MQFERMHPEALIEMIGAAEEYERRQLGLGREFLDEVRNAVDLILQNPETGILSDEDGIRIAMTRRFPYAIMFDYRASPPWILTVYHQSRHPDAWKTRVSKR